MRILGWVLGLWAAAGTLGAVEPPFNFSSDELKRLEQEALRQPEDALAWKRLGYAAWRAGQEHRQIAVKAYRQAYAADPTDSEVRVFLDKEAPLKPAKKRKAPRVPEPITRAGVLRRSLMVPGWGQVFRGDTDQGATYLAGSIATVGLYFMHANAARAAATAAGQLNYISSREKMNDALAEDNAAAFCGYAALGLYAMSALDAWYRTEEPAAPQSAWMPKGVNLGFGAVPGPLNISVEWTL